MRDALTDAEALVRAGDPRAALTALTEAVKAAPAEPRLRIFMAQLLCVLGRWERAHTQLNVVAELDTSAAPMREMVGHALRCEVLRAAVFEGRRTPMVFGQPPEWLALLIESLMQSARGASEAASGLAARAFDAAPAGSGRFNGHAFAWIADADSRLGPVLEAMINGRYYWLPFSRLASVSVEDPKDLRDRAWLPATLSFANGGEVVAMIPTRYPGSEASEDGRIQMAMTTQWRDIGFGRFAGLGHRVLTTDQGDHGLLDLRLLELDPVAETPGSEDAAGEAASAGTTAARAP